MAATTEKSGATALRPFKVGFRDEALEDLRQRGAATCWPSKELVPDQSQRVQSATMQGLTRNGPRITTGASARPS